MCKKLMSIILALLMAASLAAFSGCGEEEQTKPTVQSVRITNAPAAPIDVGGELYKLEVEITPTDLEEPPVLVWDSSDKNVATVSNLGRVTAVDLGVTTVTVIVQGTDIKDSCQITVRNPLKIKLGGVDMQLKGGASQTGDGRLKIAIPQNANDWGNSAEFEPEATDFTVTTKLNFKGTANSLQAGIMLLAEGQTAIKLIRSHANGLNRIQFNPCVAQTGLLVGNKSILDEVASSTLWLRIIKDGVNVGAYYSENGTDFNYITSGTTNLNLQKVLLFGASWAAVEATAYFEDFDINYENYEVWLPEFDEGTVTLTLTNASGGPIRDAEVTAVQGIYPAKVSDGDKTNGVYVITYKVGLHNLDIRIKAGDIVKNITVTIADQAEGDTALAEMLDVEAVPISFIHDFTPTFTASENYEVADREFKIISAPNEATDGATFLNSSIYKNIFGDTWTITVKIEAEFTQTNQFAGIALGSGDGSAVANQIGHSWQFNQVFGHAGVWVPKGNEAGVAAADGLFVNSGNANLLDANFKNGVYIRLVRINANRIQFWKSSDGETFTQIGAQDLKEDYRSGELRLYLFAWCWDTSFDVTFSEYTDDASPAPTYPQGTVTLTLTDEKEQPVTNAVITAAQGAVQAGVSDADKTNGVYVITYKVGMSDLVINISVGEVFKTVTVPLADQTEGNKAFSETLDLEPTYPQGTVTLTLTDENGEPITDAVVTAAQGSASANVSDEDKAYGIYVITYNVGIADLIINISMGEISKIVTVPTADQIEGNTELDETLILRLFADGFTMNFLDSESYELTDSYLKISASTESVDEATFLNNSAYMLLTGNTWTVTVKVNAEFTSQHQFAGFAIGAADGSAVANQFGWSWQFNQETGHVGLWVPKGNEAGTAAADGIFVGSGNAHGPAQSFDAADGYVYIRLVRINANRIQFWRSYDGVTFTQIGAQDLKDDYKGEDLMLYMFAWCWDTSFEVEFSEFTLT